MRLSIFDIDHIGERSILLLTQIAALLMAVAATLLPPVAAPQTVTVVLYAPA